jgi:alpha-N-arabinofuranosidase
VSLHPVVDGPAYEGKTNGRATFVDASAILDGDRLHVFATNRSPGDVAKVTVKVADRAVTTLGNAEILTGPGPKAANSFEQPDVVRSQPFADVRIKGGQADLELPPLSVTALTFHLS